ncbi:hypothetical protein E5720_17535 [Rhodococcus sp. PAMC28707]|uniref:hypothetical protein n=1 Tax=unclassified Rhodococcus (in: high G+C Gram-positive bacteria) TaxID=192944 RepID=UPI00109DC5D1|nr:MULTISPECIES: hypothetical protein [unclassified Rhodococcus (in: high G+C Gram-positive bacteria)]QCB51810.1 hypothetical protein E5769_17985 [Rhodococcus sp. PAMC28705]QCB60021.1 hypothetical protein E5720_17535 [Rhodococcus sp. PAMC28707]
MTTTQQSETTELEPSRFTWRYLDSAQSRALWTELIDWTTWIRDRYQLDTKIPPCWYRHGPVVEELSALMAAWTDAYYRGDEYRDDLTAWHTQWFWPVINRLSAITDFETCTHSYCDHRIVEPVTLDGIEEFVAADIAARPAPAPTPDTQPTPVTDISAAQEVRSIPAEDMEMAIASGLAEPVDPADPESLVTFEDIDWAYNTRLNAWIPAT